MYQSHNYTVPQQTKLLKRSKQNTLSPLDQYPYYSQSSSSLQQTPCHGQAGIMPPYFQSPHHNTSWQRTHRQSSLELPMAFPVGQALTCPGDDNRTVSSTTSSQYRHDALCTGHSAMGFYSTNGSDYNTGTNDSSSTSRRDVISTNNSLQTELHLEDGNWRSWASNNSDNPASVPTWNAIHTSSTCTCTGAKVSPPTVSTSMNDAHPASFHFSRPKGKLQPLMTVGAVEPLKHESPELPGNMEFDRASSLPAIQGRRVSVDTQSPSPPPSGSSQRKHECPLCRRRFPRPSGLKVHLDSHNGHKPYKCQFPGCERTFTVNSNSRRHLRTHYHGILPDAQRPKDRTFEVGFEDPIVSPHVFPESETHLALRWIEDGHR